MYPYIKKSEEEFKDYLSNVSDNMIIESIEKDELNFSDFLNLISPEAKKFLPEMRKKGTQIKKMHFGKTVRFYSPLYLSNYCINECEYCGFRNNTKMQRKRLSIEEAVSEAKVIKKYGIDSILLVSGEDPKAISIDYLEELAIKLRDIFSYISIEIYPMDENSYKRLFDAGIHGLTLYQETYNQKLYKKLHKKGPKTDYKQRLEYLEDGAKAGFYSLGIAALLGLYDWRMEAISMASHGIRLKRKFWKTKVQFSFPRITPIEGGFDIPMQVSESDMEQMMLAFRLFFHEADIYCSTRESAQFRDDAALTCATHLSAASKVIPGGYVESERKDLSQFSLNDIRSVDKMSNDLKKLGLEVVIKDWDDCFR